MNTGLMCFDITAKINKIDVDIRKIIKEYAVGEEELSKEELVRIIKNHDFKAKIKTISLEDAEAKYPLPAIMVNNNGSFCILLKINPKDKKALVFSPIEKQPKELTFDEIYENCGNEFIILSHKLFNAQIKFGFGWFFAEIMTYKQVILEVLLGSFIVQLFGLVTPLFTQVILDKVIVHRTMTTLDVLAFGFIAIMIFEFLLNISRKYIFVHTASKIDAKLGAKLFTHLFALPFTYFENRKVGNIIARVRELDQIRDFITNKSVSVIIDLFFSFVFVVMMFLYSIKLTFVVLGFVSLIAILYLLVTPELRRRLENKFQMGAQSNSYLVESVTGIQTVKSLAIEGSMRKKWEDYLGNYVKAGFQLSNMGNISGAFSGLFQKSMTIAILYIGVKLVIENKLTIGQLIAFQMFANQFTAPVLRLVNLWNELQQALLGIDRLGDILNTPIEVQSSKAITLPSVAGNVKFDNVSFKYNINTPYVIDDFSLEIKSGMSVGLVGRSGSGKSTITKLIQRLYVANEGAIYIDGIDIKHMNPYWLRQNIGVVLQENYLFSGTIRDNISLPMQNAPVELIIQDELSSTRSELSTKKQILDSMADKEKRMKNVIDVIAYDDYQNVVNEVKNLKSEVSKLNYKISELNSQKFQTLKEINAIEEEFKATNLEKLADKTKAANELQANADQIIFRNTKQKITSPCDGYVDKLFIHTLGGVVTPAQQLFAITPSNTPLLIKATVLNQDIGFVKEKMPVSVKIDTFNFQKYGLIDGEVKTVSKNSINDENLGPVYEVYITPLTHSLKVEGKDENIRTGMSLTAEINVGKRRIIEFFIYPLIKYLDEGMSVR